MTHHGEISLHCTDKPLSVLFRGDDSRLASSGATQECRFLHPTLQLLVPGVGPNVIYRKVRTRLVQESLMQLTNNSDDKFIFLTIDADHQRVVHDIYICQKLAVVIKRASENALGMFTKVERSQMRGWWWTMLGEALGGLEQLTLDQVFV